MEICCKYFAVFPAYPLGELYKMSSYDSDTYAILKSISDKLFVASISSQGS